MPVAARKNPSIRLLLAAFVGSVGGVLIGNQQAAASIQGASLGVELCVDSLDADGLDQAFKRLAACSGSESMGSNAGSDPTNHDAAPAWPETPSKMPPCEFALLPGSNGPTSTTTSASSGSSITSGANAALLPASGPLAPDCPLLERYATDRSLSLPDAPANELLRPPQS